MANTITEVTILRTEMTFGKRKKKPETRKNPAINQKYVTKHKEM